jgi:putative NADH-flavin reductase
MRIVVFGGNGRLGRRVVEEALARGHLVTVVARRPEGARVPGDSVIVVQGDATDPERVAEVSVGHDAAVSTVGPRPEDPPDLLASVARGLLAGLSRSGVRRLVVAGGAGSLEVAPGQRLLDTPDFPSSWRPIALAHAAALEVYRTAQSDVEWSYASPAALLQPGERTGRYRLGGDQLLVDEHGNSSISMEDFAIALLDEVEHPRHARRRFSVAT